jgi:hypothetical protein
VSALPANVHGSEGVLAIVIAAESKGLATAFSAIESRRYRGIE